MHPHNKPFITFLLMILCFIGVIGIARLNFYSAEQIESISLTLNDENSKYYISEGSFSVQLSSSKSGPIFEKRPAVILLHGDTVDSKSLNLVKSQFLRSGYLIIQLDVGYNEYIYFILNSTLDYLISRQDIDITKIGIMGHSRGGHYALHFGAMRSDLIRSVIVGNFGSLYQLYDDYFQYYITFINHNHSLSTWNTEYLLKNPNKLPKGLEKISLPFTENIPKNVLLVTDKYDSKNTGNPELFLYNITIGKYSQSNQFFGNYSDGSARELFLSKGIFGHTSSIFDPQVIYYEIAWMNNAMDLHFSHNSVYSIFRVVLLTFILFIIEIVLLIIIVGRSLYYCLYQVNAAEYIFLKCSLWFELFILTYFKQNQPKSTNLLLKEKRATLKKMQYRPSPLSKNKVIITLFLTLLTCIGIIIYRSRILLPDFFQYWFFWMLLILIIYSPIYNHFNWNTLRTFSGSDFISIFLTIVETNLLIFTGFSVLIYEFVGPIPMLIPVNLYALIFYLIGGSLLLYRIIYSRIEKEIKNQSEHDLLYN